MDDYDAGKKFAQDKVLDLMDEVITAYESQKPNSEDDKDLYEVWKAQVNAVKFTKIWVRTGGMTDYDGKRVCLPW